jgi:O-antigen ligase
MSERNTKPAQTPPWTRWVPRSHTEMGLTARTGVSPWLLAYLALACVGVGLLSGVNPQYGLVVAGGMTLAAVVIMDLTAGFVLFTGLSFLDLLNRSSAVSGTKVIGLILFVSYLARIATRRVADASSFVTENPALAFAMIAMLGWSGLSFAWAQSPGTALGGTGRYALNMLLLPIAYAALRERKHVVWVAAAFAAGAAFSAIFGFLVPSTSATAGYGNRATGSIGDPNAEAIVLVASIPLLISLVGVYRNSVRMKMIALVGVVIIFAGFVGTLSREGLVALGVMMVTAVIFGGRWRRKTALLLVIGVSVTSGYYLVVVPLAARQRVTSSDSSGRTTLWQIALRVFNAHPLLGVGASNFILVEGQYVNQPGAVVAFYVIDAPKVAHDAFLEALVDLGIPGLLSFGAVLAIGLGAAVRAARRFERLGDDHMELVSRAVVLCLVTVITSEFFVSAEYAKYLWLPLALGPVLLALARRSEAQVRAGSRLVPLTYRSVAGD